MTNIKSSPHYGWVSLAGKDRSNRPFQRFRKIGALPPHYRAVAGPALYPVEVCDIPELLLTLQLDGKQRGETGTSKTVGDPETPFAHQTKVPEQLLIGVRERKVVLFAGAGLSMAVGLPSWRQLLDEMRTEFEIRAEEIPADATPYLIAEYLRLKVGGIGPLRSWMDRKWSVSEAAVRASSIHTHIVELDFPIIYTTNFDRNLEVAYQLAGRDFTKIANARDLAKSREGVSQIVKFHGDFDDDSSLVLTETDYFRRLAFDAPLDVKFRADALGNIVLFLGYSMADTNIRLLMHWLWRTWEGSGYAEHRPAAYLFLVPPSPMQESILKQWGITTLSSDIPNPQDALEEFLGILVEQSKHSFRPGP